MTAINRLASSFSVKKNDSPERSLYFAARAKETEQRTRANKRKAKTSHAKRKLDISERLLAMAGQHNIPTALADKMKEKAFEGIQQVLDSADEETDEEDGKMPATNNNAGYQTPPPADSDS